MRLTPRLAFAAIAAICFAFVAFAILYMQEELGLDPCPMCILTRYTFVAIGLVAIVAALHGPARTATRVYAAVVIVLALAGAGVSARHSYLQHFPPKVESCGTDLEFLLNNLPFSQALPKIFAGTGSCSKVDWRFLGLSIPEWAGVWFVAIALAMLWLAWLRQTKTPR